MTASQLDIARIEQAAERIAPLAVRTPLLRSAALDDLVGARVLIKAEGLQRTGSFKFRGALNRILMLSRAERQSGVLAWSSGNHGLAVSEVGRLLGIHTTIVMPSDAPALKIARARDAGARVVLYDRAGQNREQIGMRLADQTGAVIVPPFDDYSVMCGQGTVGMEIVEQSPADLDAVLVPTSGGGLASGVATAVRSAYPQATIYTVEPAGFDDMARSLAVGRPQFNQPGNTSICDSLQAPQPGELTLPILQGYQAMGIAVSDQQVRAAVRYAFSELKLVIEPGAATTLAAVLAAGKDVRGVNRASLSPAEFSDEDWQLQGRTVAIVLSGANIDPALFADILTG